MKTTYAVIGTNRTIKGNKIFEMYLLGMYPTQAQADDRVNELEIVGDFDYVAVNELVICDDGQDMYASLL